MNMKKIVAAVAMALTGSAYAAQHDKAMTDPAIAKDPAAQAQTQPTQGAASANTTAATDAATSASTTDASKPSQAAGDPKVRELQQRLKNQGHDPGPVDGIMGPRTQAALDASQQTQASSSPASSSASASTSSDAAVSTSSATAPSAAAESPSFGPSALPPTDASQSSSDTSRQPKN